MIKRKTRNIRTKLNSDEETSIDTETEKNQKKKPKKGKAILSFGVDEQHCLIVYRKNKVKPFK